MKKMKKRRELDALVNGKLGRRKKGQHELLRNDSESSEVEEFSIPPKSVLRNSGSCRFCATCMTVCGFFLLALCVAAIAGLVWVHIELKKEVDQLKSQLQQVQSAPQKGLSQLASKHDSLEKDFNSFKSKDLVIINKNMTILMSQVKTLQDGVAALEKQNKESAKPPPVGSDDLAKSVADLGSTVSGLSDSYQTVLSRVNAVEISHEKLSELSEEIDTLNTSMVLHYSQHTLALKGLENATASLQLRLDLVEGMSGSASKTDVNKVLTGTLRSLSENIVENITENLNTKSTEKLEEIQNELVRMNSSLNQLSEDHNSLQEFVNQKDAAITQLQKSIKDVVNHTSHMEQLQEKVTLLDNRLVAVEDRMESNDAKEGSVEPDTDKEENVKSSADKQSTQYVTEKKTTTLEPDDTDMVNDNGYEYYDANTVETTLAVDNTYNSEDVSV